MAKNPLGKEYKKIFELNAKEHIMHILAKEYKMSQDGDTLCALYYTLTQHKHDLELFENAISYLDKEGILNKVIDFAANCGDKYFAIKLKDKVADIKFAEESQSERGM